MAVMSQVLTVDPKLEESEDAVLTRIGLTYGVLRHFNFTEERIMQCFRSIVTFELDEALDWVSYEMHNSRSY